MEMSQLVARLWAWLHTHEGRKIFRYTMVSAISTAVSFVVLALVYGVLRLWTEVPSAIFANSVATFPSTGSTANGPGASRAAPTS